MIARIPTARPRARDERGIALVIVLLVVTILTILVLEFHFNTRVTARISANVADEMKSYYLAKSGVHIAAHYLVEDEEDDNTDHLQEEWAQEIPPIPAGDGLVLVKITDESTKINLNRLVRRSGRVDTQVQAQLEQLLQILGLDPLLLPAIIDWMDADTSHFVTGADETSAYGYQTAEMPYPCKNNSFDTLAELNLVAGVTPEVYRALSPYVSLFAERQININTAEPVMLKALILAVDPTADESLVNQIVEYRQEDHFRRNTMRRVLEQELGFPRALASRLQRSFTVRTSVFQVLSNAVVGDVGKKVTAVVQRRRDKYNILYWRAD